MSPMTHAMSPVISHCPECHEERLFERPHDPVECPDLADSADGCCPELACVECGAAVLAGFAVPITVGARPLPNSRPDTPARAA
ncbi:MAG TPA: hypothetical protein VLW50_21950 [Streptosporangiaceae bacterium]|nr:hypothetical protein [Streptosporangiaceae bacterium]